MTSSSSHDDLFFEPLIRGYVEDNPRFVRRSWLAEELNAKLRQPGKRFVLLTAEPGAGKSAFIAQVARDRPDWLRYFIRRDQRAALADASATFFLLRLGYQLAARRPELFDQEQVRLSVVQRIGAMGEQAEAVGAEVKRLIASPFYQKVVEVEQRVSTNQGRVVGLRVDEYVVDTRLLPAEDLAHLALIDPARALQRSDPTQQIVILVDALDELRYHAASKNVLDWLTNCSALPENIRFVLTSRPPDEALRHFCEQKAEFIAELTIPEDGDAVKADVEKFVASLVGEAELAVQLAQSGGGAEEFASKAVDKAHGNLGYLDALARGIDRAIADIRAADDVTRDRGRRSLDMLLGLKVLPADLRGLYAFFLHQIKSDVARDRVELKDPETGETYDKPVWPTVYDRVLGVLSVTFEPLDIELIERLGEIRVERSWLVSVLDRLMQFLDVSNNRYRLYHATVAEFLTATETQADVATADLYQDATRRHRQIANLYWRLRADWAKCDDYGLAHLAAHLCAGGDVERLKLLVDRSWLSTRVDHSQHYIGFTSDLSLAWDAAQTGLRSQSASDGPSPALADCVRYALVHTSINSLTANHDPALLAQAVATGLWSYVRASGTITRMRNPWHRAWAAVFLMAVPTLTASQRELLAGNALRDIRLVVWNTWEQRRLLSRLVVHLGPYPGTLSEAVELALSVPREQVKSIEEVVDLIALFPHLPVLRETLQERLTATALAARESAWDPESRSALAFYVAPDQLQFELNALLKRWGPAYRSRIIRTVAPSADDGTRRSLLKLALRIADVDERLQALADLAGLFDEPGRARVLAATLRTAAKAKREEGVARVLAQIGPLLTSDALILKAATLSFALKNTRAMAEALVALLRHFGAGDRQATLTLAVPASQTISEPRQLAPILAQMLPYLDGDLHDQALQALIRAILIVRQRQIPPPPLDDVAPYLRGDDLAAVLLATSAIDDDRWLQSRALANLCRDMHDELRASVGNGALASSEHISSADERAVARAVLAPLLTLERRRECIDGALRDVQHGGNPSYQILALKFVAPHLRQDLPLQTLYLNAVASLSADRSYAARALAAALPQLSSDALTAGFAMAMQAGDADTRCHFLAVLIARLNGHERKQALSAMRDALPEIGSAVVRGTVLAALARHAVPASQADLLSAALDTVLTIAPRLLRVLEEDRALAAIAAALTPDLRSRALRAVFDPQRGLEFRVRSLLALLPDLPVDEAKTAIDTMLDAVLRAMAGARNPFDFDLLAALAPHLSADLHAARVLEAARQLPEKSLQSQALLAGLAPAAAHSAELRKVVREAMSDHLAGLLAKGDRAELLRFCASSCVFVAPLVHSGTAERIVQSIVEVCREWQWA